MVFQVVRREEDTAATCSIEASVFLSSASLLNRQFTYLAVASDDLFVGMMMTTQIKDERGLRTN